MRRRPGRSTQRSALRHHSSLNTHALSLARSPPPSAARATSTCLYCKRRHPPSPSPLAAAADLARVRAAPGVTCAPCASLLLFEIKFARARRVSLSTPSPSCPSFCRITHPPLSLTPLPVSCLCFVLYNTHRQCFFHHAYDGARRRSTTIKTGGRKRPCGELFLLQSKVT